MFIGDRLRAFREAKHLSQGDIESRCGLVRPYLSRVENGHTIPSMVNLEKWAHALEVPLYQLFYRRREASLTPAPCIRQEERRVRMGKHRERRPLSREVSARAQSDERSAPPVTLRRSAEDGAGVAFPQASNFGGLGLAFYGQRGTRKLAGLMGGDVLCLGNIGFRSGCVVLGFRSGEIFLFGRRSILFCLRSRSPLYRCPSINTRREERTIQREGGHTH
jgi:transcriptional regulator with XRE-family HTH domain